MQLRNENLKKFRLARILTLTSAITVQCSIQWATFDILKFSMISSLIGHEQRKASLSCWISYIESGLYWAGKPTGRWSSSRFFSLSMFFPRFFCWVFGGLYFHWKLISPDNPENREIILQEFQLCSGTRFSYYSSACLSESCSFEYGLINLTPLPGEVRR